MADWRSNLDMLPGHMRDGLERYMTHGIPPGSFLEAVLCNDLKGAVGKADHINSLYIKAWAEFMVWHMPALAQGSVERVNTWIAHGGLSGMNEYYSDRASKIEAEDASADLHE